MDIPPVDFVSRNFDPFFWLAVRDNEISRNLRGALKTRIGNLCLGPKGAALDTRENLPDALLFDRPVVIGLKDLGSDEEKALVMGFIITRLYEYREVTAVIGEKEDLRHLLIIEEAHRLLKKTGEKSSEESNMAYQAIQTFTNILAEIRAYGQGVLVVEQLPSKLAPDVIKNSNLKILHRMAPKEDRDFVGDSMILTEEQKREIAVLSRGYSVAHFEGMDKPIKILVNPPSYSPVNAFGDQESLQYQLPRDLKKRLANLIARSPYTGLLKHRHVIQTADGFLLKLVNLPVQDPSLEQSMMIKNMTTLEVFGELSNVENAEKTKRRITLFAVEDALLRRALHYGWSDSEWLFAV